MILTSVNDKMDLSVTMGKCPQDRGKRKKNRLQNCVYNMNRFIWKEVCV